MTEMEDVRRLMADVRMLRSEEGQGRDTTMCGDPKSWSPVKVTYQREMKVMLPKLMKMVEGEMRSMR